MSGMHMCMFSDVVIKKTLQLHTFVNTDYAFDNSMDMQNYLKETHRQTTSKRGHMNKKCDTK